MLFYQNVTFQVIVEIIKDYEHNNNKKNIEKLLKDSLFNPPLFIKLCSEHKLMGLVYEVLNRHDIFYLLHDKWSDIFLHYSNGNQKKNEIYQSELKIIVAKFNENNIKYATLKGAILCSEVYNIGSRFCKDIDILIDEDQLTKASVILNELGYVQGEKWSNNIREYSKQEKLFKRLGHHVLSSFTKKFENTEIYVNVELAFDIFNNKNSSPVKKQLVRESLNSSEVNKDMINKLNTEIMLLQLCFSIYKDSTSVHSIRHGKDIELIKYVDLYRFILKNFSQINWEYFIFNINILSQDGKKAVFYTFYHLELIFGDIIPVEIMSCLRPEDITFLNDYGLDEEKVFRWEKSFDERIFWSDRKFQIINNIDELKKFKEYEERVKKFQNIGE
ncbi:nucleotidyltransferase family protein [Bacillus salitolerans]|uniref:Nucleotidyltransferase family protein n=1 Tax=Bacillus salitolerans TaxID=1437434 RepID=A0ABW4LJI9_9BACI